MEPNKNTSVFLRDTCKLGQVVKIQGGYSFQSSAFTNRGIPIIRISNIDNDQIDLKNSVVFYEEIRNLDENFIAKDGDLLIAMSGATTGKAGVYKNTNLAYINQRVGKFVVTKSDKVIYKYLSYWVSSNHFTKQLSKYLASGAQPNISPKNIEDMDIVLPDTKTQEKIIRTLDAISNNISNLEALVSKQESIKKTTLKMLLTPQSNWIHTNIGSLVTVLRGESLQSKNFVSGNIPVVAGGVGIAGYHNKSNRPVNTITISASGANAGFINFYKEPIFATDCSTISETNSLDTLFLYYVLKSKQDSIFKMQTGGAQPHVHPKDISRINIFIPNLEEQQRIATQLSEIDAHIGNLKEQLAKQRAIKQGLMDYFFGN